MILFSNKMNLF